MRACSIFLLAFMLGGCSFRQGIAAAGAGIGTAGVIVLNDAYNDDQDNADVTVGSVLLITGLLTMFVAAGLEEYARSRTEPVVIIREPPPPSASLQRRAAAGQLTKAAQTAARRDECARVVTLEVQVRELDADLHAAVFMRDVAIQRCLAAPQVAPVPPTEPTPAPTPAPEPAPAPSPSGPVPGPAAPPAPVPSAATP